MHKLSDVAPNLLPQLDEVLSEAKRPELVAQLNALIVDRFTYDARDDLGYVYFVQPKPSAHFRKLSAQVSESVIAYDELGIVIDVDHDGHLLGVELIGRKELMAGLL